MRCPYGLYAEQLSGTPFTYAKKRNEFSWMYKILPSAAMEKFKTECSFKDDNYISNFSGEDKRLHVDPSQRRWKPMKYPDQNQSVTFVEGILTKCGAGEAGTKTGLAIHDYAFN